MMSQKKVTSRRSQELFRKTQRQKDIVVRGEPRLCPCDASENSRASWGLFEPPFCHLRNGNAVTSLAVGGMRWADAQQSLQSRDRPRKRLPGACCGHVRGLYPLVCSLPLLIGRRANELKYHR